jgi:hypothetical protein
LTSLKDVQVEDIDGLIANSKLDESDWPCWISREHRLKLQQVERSEQLDAATFAQVRETLTSPFNEGLTVPLIEEHISGRPGECWARVQFDPLRADRERHQLSEEHPRDSFETFTHNMVARVIKREMNVGMYVPAPNRADGTAQFYRLAAKVVTGEGMVSYIFVPATSDMQLPSIRFYRGSAFRTGEVEGIATLITDLESKLGWSAFESGQPFEPIIQEKIPYTTIVGHSLGSTIGQYELVYNDRIDEAYLYNGPGVSEEDALAFNARAAQSEKPIKLVIREVYMDDVSAFGEVHLGYQSPADKVNIDYRRYFPPMSLAATGHSHVHVWPRDEETYFGIEGGHSKEALNEIFYRKDSGVEFIRRNVGPFLAVALRAIRDAVYYLLQARELELRGLQIGSYENGLYQFSHIRNCQAVL